MDSTAMSRLPGRAALVLVFSGLLLMSSWASAAPARGAKAPRTGATWQVLGAARSGPTFYRPAGVGVDGQGNVYLSDSGNFHIVKLSRTGRVLARWGKKGSAPGAFGGVKSCIACEPSGPGDLAVSRQGTVYVDDPSNRRIEVFSSGGKLRAVWHPGLAEPVNLAVDPQGNVLAAENGNQIVKLSPTGSVLARWSIQASGHEGVTVQAVAVDPARNLYTAAWWPDTSHPLYQQHWFVQKLSPDGRKLADWPDVGGSLAVAGNGTVYVGSGPQLDLLNGHGQVVARWGRQRFASIVGLALDQHGDVYVADRESNRVLKLSPQGKTLRQWGVGGTEPGRFVTPWDIGLDARGDIYVDDLGGAQPAPHIQRLSRTGKPLAEWTGGIGHGMGVDRQGNVYVLAYPGRSVLREYGPTGRLAAEWSLDHAASRVTADAQGDVYVLTDCSAICIERLRAGRVVTSWKLPADSRVVSDGPLAVDAHGAVYVAELLPSLAYAIQRITPTARPGQVTITRVGSNSWPRLTSIAVDRRGNLYVPEQYQNRVQKLSPAGKILATWGRRESRAGQFHQPAGVAVDARGDLYVTDSGNSRVQKLSFG